jgi:hypothetical protein
VVEMTLVVALTGRAKADSLAVDVTFRVRGVPAEVPLMTSAWSGIMASEVERMSAAGRIRSRWRDENKSVIMPGTMPPGWIRDYRCRP